jgi:hypothetical protein
MHVCDILDCIDISSLMMRNRVALEILFFYSHLMLLIAPEDIVKFSYHKSYVMYFVKNCPQETVLYCNNPQRRKHALI